MIRYLLLHRIAWTDANPWFGITGAAVTAVLGCCLAGWLQ